MQKIDNLSKWRLVEAGDKMIMEKRRARKITLHLNGPFQTALYVKQAQEKAVFLATFMGRETVVFTAKGKVEVVSDQDYYVHTSENETFVGLKDGEKFTRMMVRRERDPQYEEMEYRMRLNMERRFAAQAKELEKRMRREALLNAPSAEEETEDEDDGKSSKKSDKSKSSEDDTAPPAKGGGSSDEEEDEKSE